MIQKNAMQVSMDACGIQAVLDVEKGLKLKTFVHTAAHKDWLQQPVDLFVLKIGNQTLASSDFAIQDIQLLRDDAMECISVMLSAPQPFDLTARLALLSPVNGGLQLLIQLGTQWPDRCPEEVYMHLPLFSAFGEKENKWYLSSCPVKRPDGTSVMQLHDSFDMPICNIAPDQQTGFSMELRDTNLFAEAWNQLRNCDFLHMTEEEQLKNHSILLRLPNAPLTDVFEATFYPLTDGWCEAFQSWKNRIREKMDLREYEREDLLWYRTVLFQHFTFAYSKEVFNYDSLVFEPERLIENGKAFGGYDSVLLWYQYPRLGVDERKQWDFNRDIPGGLAGMRDFTRRCHQLGVRVFLPYKPWDIRFEETQQQIVENMVEVVRETEIDGIWFDTMDQVPEGFRERIDAVRPGVVFCTEVHPAFVKSIETITGHWDQFFDKVTMPHSYILRYLFPESNAPITSRWKVGDSKDMLINRALFNGTGFAVWQDIFGAWLPFSASQKATLCKWKKQLLDHFDTYFGKDPIPMYPTLQEGLYANRFRSDDGSETIYPVYNATEKPVSGPLMRVKDQAPCTELWRNAEIQVKDGIVWGTVQPMEVLSIRFGK